MALNKTQLQNQLREIFNNPQVYNNANEVADAVADAIDEFVKTGNATGTDSHGDTHNLTIN